MEPDSIRRAIDEWTRILGAENVLQGEESLEPFLRNASGLCREVQVVLRPGSTEEVRDIVAVSNRWRVPLYPVSCGKNWGLGSALPVRDGGAVVDLRRMNRIVEVNTDRCYAVVEPGVTQGQLYDHLLAHEIPLTLNVTGSGTRTSLIGNSLDRGIGYFSSRADSLSGLEVVLGNGEVLHTGMSHFPGSKTSYLYRHGIGPSLDGLFFQSAYGIVTRAGVELLPAAAGHMAVVASVDSESSLAGLVDNLVHLRKRDILRTVIHVGNRRRTEITLGPILYDTLSRVESEDEPARKKRVEAVLDAEGFGPWSAVAGVTGTQGFLKQARKEIRRALRGFAKVRFLTDDKLRFLQKLVDALSFLSGASNKKAMLHAMRPLYGLSRGIPTDEALKSVYWPLKEQPVDDPPDPDNSPCGILYCLPFIPSTGACAREAIDLAEKEFSEHGFVPYITLNVVDEKSSECVITLAFRKTNEEETSRAHACIETLQARYLEEGFIPYRVGIQSMDQIVDESDVFWRTVRDLKQVLDPNNIISPGRYNLI
jgi:4-cresol dehydrogenase (hydroxylating)